MGHMNNDTDLDGLFGALLSIYSIREFRVLFHGPDGCRKYFSMVSGLSNRNSEGLKGHPDEDDGVKIFGTSMSADDFFSDSSKKIRKSVDLIRKLTKDPVVILPSPGASLLGVDYNNICADYDNLLVIDSSFALKSFYEAFDETTLKMIKWLLPDKNKNRNNTVNIIGINPCSRCKDYFIDELTDLLKSMGIDVICCLGSDTSMKTIEDSVNASVNILISPEYGIKTAEYYKEVYGIPYISDSDGAPVGFDSITSLVGKITEVMHVSGTGPLNAISKAKKQAYAGLMRNRGGEFDKIRYAISGDVSIVLPLTKWLNRSFSMVPCSVSINQHDDGRYAAAVDSFLESIDCRDCLNAPLPDNVDLLISDKVYSKLFFASGGCRAYIGLDVLSSGIYDLMDRPILGLQGTKFILDTMINLPHT